MIKSFSFSNTITITLNGLIIGTTDKRRHKWRATKKINYLRFFLEFGFKVYKSHRIVFFVLFVLDNSCLLFKNPLKSSISVPDRGPQTPCSLATAHHFASGHFLKSLRKTSYSLAEAESKVGVVLWSVLDSWSLMT